MTNTLDIEQQIKFYNHRWENVRLNNLKLQRCLAILEAFQSLKLKEPTILELGCGTGWLSGILGNWGSTTGIDFSSTAIELAQVRYPYVQFVRKDIASLSKMKESFDVVISHEVIEHLDDQPKHFEIAYNLLRTGGKLILTTPNRYIFENFSREKQLSWSNQPIENWLTQSELRKLASSKFDVLKLETIIPGYDPKGILRYTNSFRLRKLLKLIKVSGVYNKLYLSLGWGLHIILVAQKKGF